MGTDDMKIKDYISEAKLIGIVKYGLKLESLLVEMYEKNIAKED